MFLLPQKYTFPTKQANKNYTFPIYSVPKNYTFPKACLILHTRKRLFRKYIQNSLFFIFCFFIHFNSEDFLAFDTRSILSKWVANGYLPSPSPHMPIAALAANRVIIIVINITFYLS